MPRFLVIFPVALLICSCSIHPRERSQGMEEGTGANREKRYVCDKSVRRNPDKGRQSPYGKFLDRLNLVEKISIFPAPPGSRALNAIAVLQGQKAAEFIEKAATVGPFPLANELLDKHFNTGCDPARRRWLKIILQYRELVGVPCLVFERDNGAPLQVRQVASPDIYRLASSDLQAWGFAAAHSSPVIVYWPGLSEALRSIGCEVYQEKR